MWSIPLSELDYDGEEEAAVQAVLVSRWLSLGPETEAFEQEFAVAHDERGGAPAGQPAQAVAVQSGSAALVLALRASGVGPGDEVVLPSLTFVATANAVVQCGAQPVFADVCSGAHPLLDPADVARRLGPKTRALLPVHYGGSLCDMRALRALADSHGLALVEDAAHAAGTPGVGALGDIACFSFYANKNLATGEGGMLLTKRQEWAEMCRALRSHGRPRSSHARAHDGPEAQLSASADDVQMHGVNARLTEMQAALGRVQLRKLARGNERRRELRRLYAQELGATLEIPLAGDEAASACHLMVVLLPETCARDAVREALTRAGIQTSVHYPPIHQLTAYRSPLPDVARPGPADPLPGLPITEGLAPRLLSLPLHARLEAAQVRRVCRTLLKALPRGPSQRASSSPSSGPGQAADLKP